MTDLITVPGLGELRLNDSFGHSSFQVLLLDDDPEWIETTEEILHSKGIERIDVSRNTVDADSFVKLNRYDAVIADVALEDVGPAPQQSLQGDEWLLHNITSFDGVLMAAVTAFPSRIRDEEALRSRDIAVIRKSDDEELQLYQTLAVKADEKRAEQVQLLRGMLDGIATGRVPLTESPDNTLSLEISAHSELLFKEWANSVKSNADETIWFGDRKFSLLGLTEEVRRRSVLGQRIMKMFLRHLRYRIGLGKVQTGGKLPN
jgi:CheY-like chemotaxis protein